ncbi:sugar phosphate isomerase/epimerase family protein [Poriferisphaera sp. WC338]|uniref:sugar phosphate isomerase/epimerase family protein n=1 Tax=Poriferisphaera sp. WC338 TaxID=3425129 RepID=UPI003D81A87F
MSTYASTLGVCSWSLQPKNERELVDAIKRLGLYKVQLALCPVRENKADWLNVFKMLQDESIEIVSGMFGTKGEDYSTLETIKATGGLILDQHWDDNQEAAKEIAEIVNKHDIKTMTFHAGFIPSDPNDSLYEKLCHRIHTVADIFKAAGCETLFETGQETAEDLMAFLNTMNRDDIGINFDPANMILYGKGDPIASLTQLISKVRQVHIKDAVATKQPGTWGSEEKAGTGEVDWPAFIKVLNDHQYAGNHVIEREAGDSREADIAVAAELISSLL